MGLFFGPAQLIVEFWLRKVFMGTKKLSKKTRKQKLDDRLTGSQLEFVNYLLGEAHFNAKLAAEMAGYKCPAVMGNKLLNKEPIQRAVQYRMNLKQAQSELTIEYLDKKTVTILEADPLDCLERSSDGTLWCKDLQQVPPELRKCINKVKCVKTYDHEGNPEVRYELELMDKTAALNIGYRRLGAFQDRVKLELGLTEQALQVFSKMLKEPMSEVDDNVIDGSFISLD